MHGYLATNYDASPAKPRKSLRPLFGRFYDAKKIGNTQTLTLSFPTDDVVLTGKRLEDICSLLGKNDLACVRALSERFSELRPTSPFVAKIEIRPVKADQAAE
jgi:hypothetical protein